MATDGLTKFPKLTVQAAADQSACRANVLLAIEGALVKARMDADRIEYPVLAYFIDMAIAEVRGGEIIDQHGSRKQAKDKATYVIRRVS